MARRFGSIKPTRSGNYIGRYRIKGKDYYTPVERTRGEIEAHLRRTQRQIKNGEWQAPQPTQTTKPAPSTTFQDWATTWIGQAEKTGLSPNTARSYRSIIRKHVNPRIGTMQLRDIRPDEIRQLKTEIDAATAPGTARNILLATSAILTAAVDAGLIEANPAKAVKGIYAKSARALQPVALTSAQLNLLIDSASQPQSPRNIHQRTPLVGGAQNGFVIVYFILVSTRTGCFCPWTDTSTSRKAANRLHWP